MSTTDDVSATDLATRCALLEQQLAAARTRFELILEASNDGVWDWDLTRDEVMFSRRWKSILGYAPDEVEDHSAAFFALIHEDDRPRVNAAVQAHFERKAPYDVQFRMLAKSGEYRIIRARGQAVWSDEGVPVRFAGTHTDMTEVIARGREQLRAQELINAQRETIRSLGTPLLDLGDGVLCLPLIGAIDPQRAADLTSTVLSRVSGDGARALIIDLTAAMFAAEGSIAHMLKLLRAVTLLGARCSVCGLSPELARELAERGVELLQDTPVHRTLGAALRAALRERADERDS